jgi:hypothetical protein
MTCYNSLLPAYRLFLVQSLIYIKTLLVSLRQQVESLVYLDNLSSLPPFPFPFESPHS